MTEELLYPTKFDLIVVDNQLYDIVTCNFRNEADGKCDAPARWAYVCESCKDVWLHCHRHRRGLDRWLSEAPTWSAFCSNCEAPMPVPIPWSAV